MSYLREIIISTNYIGIPMTDCLKNAITICTQNVNMHTKCEHAHVPTHTRAAHVLSLVHGSY